MFIVRVKSINCTGFFKKKTVQWTVMFWVQLGLLLWLYFWVHFKLLGGVWEYHQTCLGVVPFFLTWVKGACAFSFLVCSILWLVQIEVSTVDIAGFFLTLLSWAWHDKGKQSGESRGRLQRGKCSRNKMVLCEV